MFQNQNQSDFYVQFQQKSMYNLDNKIDYFHYCKRKKTFKENIERQTAVTDVTDENNTFIYNNNIDNTFSLVSYSSN